MSTTNTPPPPRRKLHLMRWMVVVFIAVSAWGGWRVVAFRLALKEARALGWWVSYTEPAREIRADWRAAFKKETWADGVSNVFIPTGEAFQANLDLVRRLNPEWMQITDASALRDLSGLRRLTRLQGFVLNHCAELTSIDALKERPDFQWMRLRGCRRLANVDALKGLRGLSWIDLRESTSLTQVDALGGIPTLDVIMLEGCTGLTPETVAGLKAALPRASITGP